MASILKRYFALTNIIAKYREDEDAYLKMLKELECRALEKFDQHKVSLMQIYNKLSEEVKTIQRFRSAASKYATLNGYVPRPEAYNKNQLMSLYTMLGTDNGKRYASELLCKCCNALLYIEQQQEELNSLIDKKKRELLSSPEISDCRKKLKNISNKICTISYGDDFQQLAELIKQVTLEFQVENSKELCSPLPMESISEMYLGYVHLPYTVELQQQYRVTQVLGKHYIPENHTIRVPYSISAERINEQGLYSACCIQIGYNEQTRNETHKLIQGMVFNILRKYAPVKNRVTYVDLETYNPEYLGVIKAFTGEDKLVVFPRTEIEAVNAIIRMETSALNEPEQARYRRYLIVRGRKANTKVNELLRRICNNSEKNNIAIILIDRQEKNSNLFSDFSNMHISSQDSKFMLRIEDKEYPFEWFNSPEKISKEMLSSFELKYASKKIVNEYEDFFPLDAPISYSRDRRPVTLPFGVNEKGELQYLTFEGMEFAAFIMGASGSGKSTLLHALIAGIIRNYHPDEVELWLADLKLMEFANYTHHRPPHIKYILMDSSKEIVYNFIDCLYEEMERRQILLSAYGTNDCKNLPPEKYLPLLFVIIDEFSALSDVIRNDDNYKRKLEQILVRGRGPGLRLVFASQSYTDGAPGLTKLAKNQIQTRIALRNTSEEIKQTLDIPSGQYTDEIRHNIDTLPAHYALRRIQHKDGSYHVDKVHGLYFNGRDEEGWKSRYDLIDRVNASMKAISSSSFDAKQIDQYVEKKPVMVSGKSLQAFPTKNLKYSIERYKRDPQNIVFEDDFLVQFGQPRMLTEDLFAMITSERSENIFLLAGNKESSCGMSVIESAVQSIVHQDGNVQIWAHPRNRIYHWFKESVLRDKTIYEGTEEVCNAIDILKNKIQTGQRGKEIIVLLGMENIFSDFEFQAEDGFSLSTKNQTFKMNLSSVTAQTEEEIKQSSPCNEDRCEILELEERFYEEGIAQGKTEEQIEAEFEIIFNEHFEKKRNFKATTAFSTIHQESRTRGTEVQGDIELPRSKDYRKDFQELVRNGSRLGYHFMLCVNNYQAMQEMGLALRQFNHRVSFKTDSAQTSMFIFDNSSAYKLSDHACYYAAFGASEGGYVITPYLHENVTWDSWIVDSDGIARNMNRI